MARLKRNSNAEKERVLRRNLLLVSLSFLAVKLMIILSIKFGGWLGSDAEGYIKGAVGLLKDGFLSKEPVLSYLPAGYPMIIWLFSLATGTGSFITNASSLMVISIFQSLIYFSACAFFVERLRRTNLRRFALPTAVILGVNPTLSLSSLVVGYESLVASCMLFSVALLIKYQQNKANRKFWRTLTSVALLQSFAGIMQPRVLLIGASLLVLWAILQDGRRLAALTLIAGSFLLASLPAVLALRNYEANGNLVVSSQLGVTMSAGAGDGATGGFTGNLYVKCPESNPPVKVSDSDLVKCVINWYASHPAKTARLILNKAVFYWSPWSGPVANGTMARNPWLKVDPVQKFGSTIGGHKLVFGMFGKVISWIWLLGGVALLLIGFGALWEREISDRHIALLIGLPVLLAMLTSLGTIGDHRYRIPTMGMSLFLQIVGYAALKERVFGGPKRPTLETKGRAR